MIEVHPLAMQNRLKCQQVVRRGIRIAIKTCTEIKPVKVVLA